MKTKTLSIIIFLATIILITAPLLILTSAGSSDSFSATLSIGNVAPTIAWVSTGSDSPSEGTTRVIYLQFNVTDNNTVSDINSSSVFMNISKAGETTRTSTSCISLLNSSDSKTEEFNCSFTIYYYDGPGIWDICAYARDDSGSSVSDCTSSDFTMGNTDSIDVINTTMAFSGNQGETDKGPGHIVINNTGNQNYLHVGLNATYLSNNSDVIGVGNFTVNITNSPNGQALTENSFLNITGSNLSKSSTEDLYFYMDIPAGIPSVVYNSNRNWIIDPSTT
jgi:hypothetical protein